MRPEWKGRLYGLVCGIVGIAAFLPTLRYDFVYDDHAIVRDNWIVTQPDTGYRFLLTSYWPPKQIDEKRMRGGDILYRPLTIGALRLQYLIHGGNPRGYHFVNILLHGMVSTLLCAAVWRLWNKPAVGLIAGVLFAAHPIHADAVAPIVGQSELLAAFFVLWLIARHLSAGAKAGLSLLWFHLGSTLLFAAAIFSKEHALFIWPVLLLIDIRQRKLADSLQIEHSLAKQNWLDYLARRGHIGFAYAVVAFFGLRFYVFGEFFRKAAEDQPYWSNPLASAGWTGHLLAPFQLLWLTIRLMFDPSHLVPLWGPNALVPPHSIHDGSVMLGILIAVVLLTVCLIGVRSLAPATILLVGFMLLMLMPLHVIPTATWYFAERWLYLPTAMLLGAVAGLGRKYSAAGVATACCAALLLLPWSWSYAAAWQNDEQLNVAVLRRHPDSFQAGKNLGVVLLKLHRYEEALHVAGDVAERFPDNWQPYHVMYEAYTALGNKERAEEAKTKRDERHTREMIKYSSRSTDHSN